MCKLKTIHLHILTFSHLDIFYSALRIERCTIFISLDIP